MNFTGIYRFDVSWLSGVARLFPVVENMVQRKCYTAELQPGWRTGNKSGYFHTIQKVGRPSYERPPFYMGFCNGVDENFQHHFVINIDYCITEACITNSITV